MAFSIAPLTTPASLQQLASVALVVEGREHEQLAGDELIAALLRQLVGDVEQAVQVVGDVDLAGRALDLRQPIELRAELRSAAVDVDARLDQERLRRCRPAVEQRRHHVRRLDELIVAADAQRLRVGQRLLEAAREFVHAHGLRPGVFATELALIWGRGARISTAASGFL